MLPTNRTPTHPGVILKTEFCEPHKLTHDELASHIGVPVEQINEIIKGERCITSETAWLLAQTFETSPEFWLNLQIKHDLACNRPEKNIAPLKKKID